MMKFINIKTALLVATTLVFAACSDDVNYEPGAYANGQGYYFSSEANTSIELSLNETSFDVEVCRSTVGSEATVAISVTVTDADDNDADASGKFTIPSSVTFSSNQSSTTLTIGYDPDEVEYDNYNFILSVEGSGETTPYGLATYEFTAAVAQPWTSLGIGYYTDDFMTTFYGVDNVPYEVEIQENGLTPGLFRLVYPYGEAYPYNEAYDDGTADWDLTKTYYLEINACDPDGVYITQQESGMDWGYGNVIMWSLANYYMVNGGYTLEEVKAAGYCGTYADGVITFPEETLLICMPGYADGFYYANYNGAFKVVMPGVVLADYSINVTYNGKYSDANGANYAIANVTFGEDVESARVALVEGKDVSSAIAAIENDAIEYTEITASGNVTFPCEESGTYSLVVVSYGNGSAQESASATFKYTVGTEVEETWTAQYEGYYTYSLIWGGDDPGLILYQSDTDPNHWKIEHWGYDVDFGFTFDQETGEIIVDDQETGYDHPNYGTVYVDDLVDYTGVTDYGESFYYDGTFYFAVVYYCSAGIFDYGYETFTLTGASQVKGMSKAKAKSSNPKFKGATLHADKFRLKDVTKSVFK